MAPSLRSPSDAHDTPLSARHPRHPRHPARSPSLTEFPDSPSVYSYAYHSPETDAHFDTVSPSHLSHSPDYPDFDDETASTTRSLSTEDVQGDSDDCTDDASHRISLQGPKIRFHSRAPWETEYTLPHGEQSDKSTKSGTVGKKLRGKTSRADNIIRTFTRRTSLTSRPSIESARSQVLVSSFEITARDHPSSRGALYDLARQSTPTSSFAFSATFASAHAQDFAHTTNYPQYLTQTHDSLPRATVSLDMASSATTLEKAPMRPSSSETSRVGYERSTKPFSVPLSQERQSRDQFVHPYANPDLVSYVPSPETVPSHPISGDMVGSDSNSTITDSTSTRSAAFSVVSAETSTTSLASRDVPHGNRRINGKEISSPIPVFHQSDGGYVDRSTRFLSLHPPPAGFEGPRRNIPAVTLISLQEAQARERFRGNTVHTTVSRQKHTFPGSDDIPEATKEQKQNMAVNESGNTIHIRARSTSAGARHTETILLPSGQPQDADMKDGPAVSIPLSAVPGRSLKHKKSGFMRLFGGRNSEGEKERGTPPPIPPTIDVCAEDGLQTHGTIKTPKPTLQRVPRSSLSPPLHGSGATLASIHNPSSGPDGPDGKGVSLRKRQPPPLSIVTKTLDHSIPTSVSGKSSLMGLDFIPSPLSLAVPQSAPPGNSDFPGLKLRPVSTSFSSHFADIVTGTAEELPRDVHTPSSATSSTTALSPFTPVSMRRSDDTSATAVEAPGEEYLTIKGLQDQLAFAKKAWQQQIWELRGQIRDLTSELEDLQAADNQEYCEVCGRGEPRKRYALPLDEQQPRKVGVVNRPRARTGDAARFANGN